MFRKIALGLLILLAVGSLLLVGQIKVATYFYDSEMDRVLSKIERVMPGLDLSYEPDERHSSFTVRSGRLHYSIPLKRGSALAQMGHTKLAGAVDIKLVFGPLRISGAFDSVEGAGNLEQVMRQFNIDPITFTGAFKATAITPRLEGTVKTDSFMIPTATGVCKLGQNSFNFYATSTSDVDVELASAGIVCEGAMRYDNRPNYRLDLLGLNVKFLPRIVNKKPHFDSLVVNIKNLDFKFSTLYAIGFSPEDKVRDPSLQEAISFSDMSTKVSLSEPDSNGMSKLSFDNSGNYHFAFPYIMYGQVQPFYKLDNFKFAGSLERISIPILINSAQSIIKNASADFDTKKILSSIMSGFTEEILMTIDQFGYTHNGMSFVLDGNTALAFDFSGAKPRIAKFDSTYNIKADKSLVEEIAAEEYNKALEDAVRAGQIYFDGRQYSTTFTLAGKQAALNHIPLSGLVSQDDMLYEEEQKAQEAEMARQKAEQEALKQEIESATQAQDNLPSIVEGNLNGDLAE